MTKILMPINPVYVDLILLGKKKYEYRKTLPKKGNINTMIIYTTSPVMKVEVEVEVLNIIVDSKEKVWNKTKNHSATTKEYFDKYFEKSEIAVAYELGKITKYEHAITLKEIGVNYFPQSFIYIP